MEAFFQANTFAIKSSSQVFGLSMWLSAISLDDTATPYNPDLCKELIFPGSEQPTALHWIRSMSFGDR
ncbi:hypothetical protein Vi05172_g6651 [Venturia inaequalis]|nr:hypothetical protein Vi05172_g6651 [Venturia inaequalis]